MPDDLSRLCIHTITTKPWSIEEAVEHYADAGVKGITVWRQWLDGRDPQVVGERIRAAGLTAVSLCRGGFFPAASASDRQAAINDNLRAVDEAAAIGAPLIVLVCGASPDVSLPEARKQIQESIEAVLPYAVANDIKLSIEPLHPMYADSRSAINTLKQANDLCAAIDSPWVGVAVDVYHLWWDPDLESEIKRCGQLGWLHAFHICDWLTRPSTCSMIVASWARVASPSVRFGAGWSRRDSTGSTKLKYFPIATGPGINTITLMTSSRLIFNIRDDYCVRFEIWS